ncbi:MULTISPECIES: SDR family NAD(P)-dependent oxidoreductase [unclassified Bradyrhizobium]|uniref:SDR family NAD(P)-dependent oxidoreductase n=1 Tax=Bradyrhizobium sp. USDA 4541 TaxID=2817704 RepID=UPI0020A46AB9|nr:SDR family oxidoreductase [Bradyrhizobium sp. USDA 4541]
MLLAGARRGVGHATAELSQERGWRILTVSRQSFAEECAWLAGREDHIQADQSDDSQIDRLAARVRGRLLNARPQALVNNADISPEGPSKARLGVATTDAATWAQVLDVNLVSTALLVRALLTELEVPRGSIVNVTSIAGERVHPFAGVAYMASKAALASLTRGLAHEFDGRGVRASAISPGEIEASILSPGTDELVAAEVPLRCIGDALEVAKAIHLLCTSASSYINGAEIHVNGGQHV